MVIPSLRNAITDIFLDKADLPEIASSSQAFVCPEQAGDFEPAQWQNEIELMAGMIQANANTHLKINGLFEFNSELQKRIEEKLTYLQAQTGIDFQVVLHPIYKPLTCKQVNGLAQAVWNKSQLNAKPKTILLLIPI